MSETKKPQAGEWWRTRDNERVYVTTVLPEWCLTSFPVIGLRNTYGDSTEEYTREGFYTCAAQPNMNDLVEHLHNCTGFDWVEPPAEVWPKWYSAFEEDSRTAYVVRNKDGTCNNVGRDGKAWSGRRWDSLDDDREEITEAEALARIIPPTPVESPDDWVTQDQCLPRAGTDQWRWMRDDGTSYCDWMHCSLGRDVKHGFKESLFTLQVRCRRKDLPPLPEPKAERAPVRLWINNEDGVVFQSDVRVLAGDEEIHHDANGFYVERPTK